MAKEFRENFIGLVTLLVVGLSIYGFLKLNSRSAAAHTNAAQPAPTTDIGAADQYLFAPVYTTTEGQSSALGLNNSTNHPITAHVTLFNKHGLSLSVPDITLDAHKNHAFDGSDIVKSRP